VASVAASLPHTKKDIRRSSNFIEVSRTLQKVIESAAAV
jgi:hypothetical protein